jgi:septum formation protein
VGEYRERGFHPPHGAGDGEVEKTAPFIINTPAKIVSPELILASSSPRRRDLLSSLGVQFRIVPAQVQEIPFSHEAANDFAVRVAEQKALTIGTIYPDAWVIGADTIVVIEGEILGKPRDSQDAQRMLRRLANREHVVMTGYAVVKVAEGKKASGLEETRVKINALAEREIAWYINTGEPFDKAGGYAIQGKGAFMVEWIAGSYTNVVGLPLCQLIRLLKEMGITDIF